MKNKEIDQLINLSKLERIYNDSKELNYILHEDEQLEDNLENLIKDHIKNKQIINIKDLNKKYNKILASSLEKAIVIYAKDVLDYQQKEWNKEVTYEEILNELKDNIFIKNILEKKDIFKLDKSFIEKLKNEGEDIETIIATIPLSLLFIYNDDFIESDVAKEYELNNTWIELAKIILNNFTWELFYPYLIENKNLPKEINISAKIAYKLLDFFENEKNWFIGDWSVYFETLREVLDENYKERSLEERRIKPDIFVLWIELDDIDNEDKEFYKEEIQLQKELEKIAKEL